MDTYEDPLSLSALLEDTGEDARTVDADFTLPDAFPPDGTNSQSTFLVPGISYSSHSESSHSNPPSFFNNVTGMASATATVVQPSTVSVTNTSPSSMQDFLSSPRTNSAVNTPLSIPMQYTKANPSLESNHCLIQGTNFAPTNILPSFSSNPSAPVSNGGSLFTLDGANLQSLPQNRLMNGTLVENNNVNTVFATTIVGTNPNSISLNTPQYITTTNHRLAPSSASTNVSNTGISQASSWVLQPLSDKLPGQVSTLCVTDGQQDLSPAGTNENLSNSGPSAGNSNNASRNPSPTGDLCSSCVTLKKVSDFFKNKAVIQLQVDIHIWSELMTDSVQFTFFQSMRFPFYSFN